MVTLCGFTGQEYKTKHGENIFNLAVKVSFPLGSAHKKNYFPFYPWPEAGTLNKLIMRYSGDDVKNFLLLSL